MINEKSIYDFQLNDTYSFEKTFSEENFAAFSVLSGDKNPLHHDHGYAKKTAFEEPIVPLHLAASPLSAIAGMVFPGHRSLYLSHQLKALNPIPYNVSLTYSAKILAIDTVNRILTIRTIVFHERELFIEAEQKIQAREDKNEQQSSTALGLKGGEFIQPSRSVLVTGAAGALGQCVAQSLARQQYDLVLQVREKNKTVLDFVAMLESKHDVQVELIECDLANANVELFCQLLSSINQSPLTVIHCASPALDADLNVLMSVNYSAIKHLTDALLPAWLKQQSGTVIFVSSSATHFHPEGWQDYCAAKAAGVNFCSSFHHRFQPAGLTAKVIAPGLIATEFSEGTNLDREKAMLPEQVAENIVEMLEGDYQFYSWVEQNGTQSGSYGFFAKDLVFSAPLPERSSASEVLKFSNQEAEVVSGGQSDQLRQLISQQLGLQGDIDWRVAGVSVTPRWDSLNHMLLLVEVERRYGISIESTEMDRTSTYLQLSDLIAEKLS